MRRNMFRSRAKNEFAAAHAARCTADACQAALTAVSLVLLLVASFPAKAQQPTAVIDTTAGRFTCILFSQERPVTAARFIGLAEGTEPWTAPDGSLVRDKPFYDGNRLFSAEAGVSTGSRGTQEEQPAGATFPAETGPPIAFDRPGLIAMMAHGNDEGPSRFILTDHANTEMTGRAVVFGQCDDASVKLVAAIRRALQQTDNTPATPYAINHITILHHGEPAPPAAPPVAPSAVLPALKTTTLAPPSGPEPSGPTAIFETTAGNITCRLFARESPIATAMFLGLVKGSKDWTDPRTHVVQHHHPFYDGLTIDRVLPDFYIQFGDVTGDTSGATDIGFRFKNEHFPGLTFDRPGRLAFGNDGPDTNSSELFMALNPMHWLDAGFPILGQCDPASIALVDRLANGMRDESNRPVPPIVIRHIAIQK